MKIATWNINSIRARTEHLLNWLRKNEPDVLCVQETKCTDEQFPFAELQALGYRAEHFGQKSYNGVALISKVPLTDVRKSMNDGDEQSRLISGVFGSIRIVNLYAPNGQHVGSDAFQYKLTWYGAVAQWVKRSFHEKELLVCGDFNVAPTPADTWDPRIWHEQVLCTTVERNALKTLTETNSLTDLIRHRHPTDTIFSWWDYRASGFKKNQGLRIDHIFVTEPLLARCTNVAVDVEPRKEKLPSDHAPVVAIFTD